MELRIATSSSQIRTLYILLPPISLLQLYFKAYILQNDLLDTMGTNARKKALLDVEDKIYTCIKDVLNNG